MVRTAFPPHREAPLHPYILEILLYTALALSTEAVFTGIADFFRNCRRDKPLDWTLPCRTSLWSIPVYAISATFAFNAMAALMPAFFGWSWWLRGLVYTICTFSFEYAWGFVLEELTGTCPWRYEDSKWRIWRYINPEYALLWFFFGFALEWVHLDVLPRFI